MSIGLDHAHNQWEINLSIYLGCAVFDTANYYVIPNACLRGYIGGYNSVPFLDPENPNFDSLHETNASIFVFDCGGNQKRRDIPDPLTLSFRYQERFFKGCNMARRDVFARKDPLLPCAFYYLYIWGYNRINHNRSLDISTIEKRKMSTYINEVMLPGPQKNWNSNDNAYSHFKPGSGHISKILPGNMTAVLKGSRVVVGKIEVNASIAT